MQDHVYKTLELTGSSPKSIEAAVENAVARASKTIRDMRIICCRWHVRDCLCKKRGTWKIAGDKDYRYQQIHGKEV